MAKRKDKLRLFRRPFAYEQLRDDIMQQIRNNEVKSNERIFSENQLAKIYGISPKSVRKAIAELVNKGYLYSIKRNGTFVANQKGSSKIKSKRLGIIGLVITDLAISFNSDIARGVEDEVHNSDYQLILGNSDNNIQREEKYMRRFCRERIDGMIIVTGKNSPNNKYFQSLDKSIPLVIIDSAIQGVRADYVTTDDITGAYEATKYLIELGHRKIAHLTGWSSISTSRNRLAGYKKALNEAGIENNGNIVKQTDFTEEGGNQATKELLAMGNRPTAIFAVNDIVAVGAAKAIQELKLRLPDDISLVGFGGLRGLDTNISLTTVVQPAYEMGKKAAEILVEKISKREPSDIIKEIILPTKLVIRASSGECISDNNKSLLYRIPNKGDLF